METRGQLSFSDTYDRESDVYYVSLETGEPSYCVEVDDSFLVELGLFTNMLTGFRVLNLVGNNFQVRNYKDLINQLLAAQAHSAIEQPTREQREHAAEEALKRILEPA